MIWAACCIAFFGLLQVSEFTTPTQTHFNPSSHLSLSYIALDSRTSSQVIRITLKQSKTDQLRHRTHLYLGKTGHHVCPIGAIIPYLIARGNRPGPLFMLKNGKMLTRSMFNAAIHKVLLELKLNPQCFNTQLQDWCSHLCQTGRNKRCTLKSTRLMEKSRLSQIHPSLTTGHGKPFQELDPKAR